MLDTAAGHELGRRIADLVAQGDAAKEKAEQFYKAAGIHLIELRERKPDGIAWASYVKDTTGLGKSRAYELIAIAEGRSTVEETRAGKAESMQRLREDRERPPRGGHDDESAEERDGPSDDETLEQAFLMRAGEALRYAFYEGPKTAKTLRAARQTAQAWMNLANELKGD